MVLLYLRDEGKRGRINMSVAVGEWGNYLSKRSSGWQFNFILCSVRALPPMAAWFWHLLKITSSSSGLFRKLVGIFLPWKLINVRSDNYYNIYKDKTYFMTMTVVDWFVLFTRVTQKQLIVDLLKYCQKKKGLNIFGYCLCRVTCTWSQIQKYCLISMM